jgi:AraC family transcriptional regulator
VNDGAPRNEYARRMHRVQAHIDQHLGEVLVLEDLASVAHFSPFHFHRLFTAWMSETLGDYLRRRRLEVAALRLLSQPRTPVLHIALMVGFGSGEAFAHAFKGRFGCSASHWRRQKAADRQVRQLQLRKLDQAVRKLDQDTPAAGAEHGAADSGLVEQAMNVTVTERPPVRVVYMRHVGPYGPAVAAFWQQKFYPYAAQHALTGRPCYGISHDDPDITAPEKCRFDICTEVDDAFMPSGEALVTTIPGGRYAMLPFKGTPQTIHAAWSGLMRDWLPASGWQLDGRPTFEYYPPNAEYDDATGTFECQIVIPLAPL